MPHTNGSTHDENLWDNVLRKIVASAESKTWKKALRYLEKQMPQEYFTMQTQTDNSQHHGETKMKLTLVRYSTHPDTADSNEQKVAAVFRELEEKKPKGLQYMVLRLASGEFLHLACTANDTQPLAELESFQDFRRTGAERWRDLPIPAVPKLVGSYGFDFYK